MTRGYRTCFQGFMNMCKRARVGGAGFLVLCVALLSCKDSGKEKNGEEPSGQKKVTAENAAEKAAKGEAGESEEASGEEGPDIPRHELQRHLRPQKLRLRAQDRRLHGLLGGVPERHGEPLRLRADRPRVRALRPQERRIRRVLG